MSEAAVQSFLSYSFFECLRNTGGRVFILVITACENFTFNLILTAKTSLLYILIQLTN